MNFGALPRTAAAILIAVGMTAGAVAQPADEEEDSYETRDSRMMDGMGEGPMMGMHGKMHGHTGPHRRMMMKIMFTIADTNGDGALSFDEVSAIHKRVFDGADSNKDGRLTREEIRAFVRD